MTAFLIWVCPNCASYYGASGVNDLNEKWNTNNKGEKTFRRSRCPNTECARQDIHRQPVITVPAFHQ